MKTHFKIKPSPGAKVRDPVTTQHLTDGEDGNGELKPRSSYWIRRVKEGVVVIVAVQATEKKASDKP